MTKHSERSTPREIIGVDLGDRCSQVTILGNRGELLERVKLKTTLAAFAEFFEAHREARVAFEVGGHSLWVDWLLKSMGLETIVANPRAIPVITKSHKKNDVRDADLLAELAYVRPSLLEPIRHRGPDGYADRCLLTARASLVQCRTALINSVRGMIKSVGRRVANRSPSTFHRFAELVAPPELRPAIKPVLEQIESLTERIRAYDKAVDKAIGERYAEAQKLQQVHGVGPVTALNFVLAIEDPTRFKRSRDVGPYFGLVPKQRQSSGSDPELRISKAGDPTVRSLLVQCAQYILGPFGQDCDLRRFGERIASKGSKKAKRRAVVAVARKLAILLHALWVRNDDYEPLRTGSPEAGEAIA